MADLSALLGAAGIGGAVGQAIVRLELDSKKYLAEMETAKARTVEGTTAMGTNTSKFAGLAQTAFLGAGVAAVAFGAYAVKSAIEANEAHIKLQNTFENNPKLIGESVTEFERFAGTIRDLTGVDDEAISSSIALLGAFDTTGDQIKELIPLIVDLSAKYGVDLEAATKAVGKAITGNTGSLARYGIVIDKTAAQTDAYSATVDGLGKNQGFAAEQAKTEPWRLLGQAFEELAETVGQKIVPALQDLVTWISDYGVPALKELLDGIMAIFDPDTYTGIPVIGEAFKAVGTGVQAVTDAVHTSNDEIRRNGLPLLSEMKQTAGLAEAGFISLSETFPEIASMAERGFKRTGDAVAKFAHMSGKDLREWSADIKESFDDVILSLEDTSNQSGITDRDFLKASRHMQRQAEELAGAMKRIAEEQWVNENYIKFLSELGPEWIVAFADLTVRQQRIAQDAWKESTKSLDAAGRSQDRMLGLLRELDKGPTKHEVIIEYKYVGFDPSKPGMSGSAQQR